MKKFKGTFFTIAVIILSIQAIGQKNFLGTWKGELTQEPESRYYFEINIDEIDSEGKFKGSTYETDIWNGKKISKVKDYVKLSCTGYIKNGVVYFSEQKILEQKKSSNYDWCVKNGELKIDTVNNEYFLSGIWQGLIPKTKKEKERICRPGLISVKKDLNKEIGNNYVNEYKRKIRIDKTIRVQSKKVIIKVWDQNLEDGDIISLYLNEEKVYKLLNKKYKLKTHMKKGLNLFILHAENLGNQPPNTAAVSIKDGNKTHNLILKSNLSKSAALEIIR
jgi:hypothetical protein